MSVIENVKSGEKGILKRLLTVTEIAELLQGNRSTVWRWYKNGVFTTAFNIGRNWRIHWSEVEGIIEGLHFLKG